MAKAAAALLSNEKTRKGMGWAVAAVLSPIILVLALLCVLGSGAVEHNISAAQIMAAIQSTLEEGNRLDATRITAV